jgi:hypothetical protein
MKGGRGRAAARGGLADRGGKPLEWRACRPHPGASMLHLAPAAVTPVPAVSPACRSCKRYAIPVPSPLRGFSSKTETDTQVIDRHPVISSPSPTPTDRRAQSLPAAEVRIFTFWPSRPGRAQCMPFIRTRTRPAASPARIPLPKWGMNHGRQAPYATPLRRRSRLRSPGALGHINPTRRPSPDWCGFGVRRTWTRPSFYRAGDERQPR